jgi:hypothetical protein
MTQAAGRLSAGVISDVGVARVGGPANWEEFSQWQGVTIPDKARDVSFFQCLIGNA